MLKVMGMKSMGIRGSFNFKVQRWVGGGNIYKDIHLDVDHGSEGCNLGREVMFDGLHLASMEEYKFLLMVEKLSCMEECMFLLMVEKLALSCLTSCWVFVKLEDKELMRASKSWLWVWAMMKRENERDRWEHI